MRLISTIPDSSHHTGTFTSSSDCSHTDVTSSKPSLLVTHPPINTKATKITTSLPEITPFIALQLRVARLEQEMSEVKKDDHSADGSQQREEDLICQLQGQASTSSKDDDQSSKKTQGTDASATKQHPALTSTGWQITDTRDAGVDSSMHRSDPESEHSEQSSDDITMQDEGNDSDMEDTDNAHIPKVRTWKEEALQEADLEVQLQPCKAFHKNSVFLQYQLDECHKRDNKCDLSNPEGHQILRNIYEPLPLEDHQVRCEFCSVDQCQGGESSLQPQISQSPKRTIEVQEPRETSINQHPSETMVFHNKDGNPARANIKQALGRSTDSPQELAIPGISSKRPLSKGIIPGMRPTQALTVIQTMADHSQKWHNGTTSRKIRSSSSNDGLAALVDKLDNLGRDMKKLKESVHVIQVGCQICEGPHLDKDCPLNEEVKLVEEVRYEEFGRTTPFNENNGGRKFLVETIKKYIEEAFMRISDDEDDIEGIINYLEPTSYDGFIDLDEEEYNKRRCRLLGMTIQKLEALELDDFVYKTNVSETITSVPRNESTASKSSKDSLEQPKDVRPSAPIIEEWESDSDDDCMIRCHNPSILGRYFILEY
ncbi:hypothetical protein Tco_0790325 [Tanacetum coccineum]